jgi:hypothetical protein
MRKMKALPRFEPNQRSAAALTVTIGNFTPDAHAWQFYYKLGNIGHFWLRSIEGASCCCATA